MTESILKYWPFKESKPRQSQITALEWVEQLPADIKYILCEMPVGAGKSPFGMNVSGFLSNSLGSSYILTPQRILQKQYEDSFDPKLLASVVGKSNYECSSKKTNCDIGSVIKPQCFSCPAKEARDHALASPNTVLNYTLALLLFKYGDENKVRRRRLMIFDECHTLEHHLTEFNSVSVSDLRCKKIGLFFRIPKTLEAAIEWVSTEYTPALRKKYIECERIVETLNDELEFDPRALTIDEKNHIRNLKDMKEHLMSIDSLLGMEIEEIKERYVLVGEKQSFKFKELYGRNVFHSLVKQKADKFLFMSSTILNKDAFCRDLGLNPEEAAFISIESEFPVDNRPVVYMPQMKMNYEWNTDQNIGNRKDMVLKIRDVCELHTNESGIIHTGSFQIADWLVNELSGAVEHNILHHNPGAKLNRDDVIAEYLRVSPTEPTLLISPSITEGLDLKNDLGRFAIFVKVPFPFLGDAWVKKRMEISNEWYSRQAMIAIIQGAGRIVRSSEDWGVTYILDSSFNMLYNKMQGNIPHWWKEGLQRV